MGIRDFVKGQPKWCEKGKLTFPEVPSTIMNQTGSGICDHIKDSGACFYVRKRASNSTGYEYECLDSTSDVAMKNNLKAIILL